MNKLCSTLALTLFAFILSFQAAAEDTENTIDIPEGYTLREQTVGDATVQFLVRSDLTAEELSEIAPAAGPDPNRPFIGPRRETQHNNVWATENFE